MGRHTKRVIRELARRTHLRVATVKDLLAQGWTYKEAVLQPIVFIAPFPEHLVQDEFEDMVPQAARDLPSAISKEN